MLLSRKAFAGVETGGFSTRKGHTLVQTNLIQDRMVEVAERGKESGLKTEQNTLFAQVGSLEVREIFIVGPD